MSKWPKQVTIKEVGPRDGLQNEKTAISTEDKIAWINQLSKTGLTYIEITSFVHPKWIPQLSDALEVATRIERAPGVTYAALVPNQKGLEKALTAQVDEVAVFMSASETHNRKNINKSIEETFPVLEEVVRAAKQEGKTVRGYVSTVFGCPYEGNVSVEQVIRVSERLFDMGIDELSLGDTIGVATPKQVQELLEIVLKRFPKEKLAMHFHDTRGTALANILISLEMGITTFDSSLGGLGGCPYAPGASGNVATDDLVYMLHGMDIATGIDVGRLTEAALFIQEKIGRPLSSRYLQTIST
ncbi:MULTISPECIES: hydroxymethylglutaryl-CoA lyase [Bacillaceae]|uniref:Pyruvate carboxyltransferase n=1 Tax=Geobacillus sp. (strain WCH70) TaxID=471223 RepID=C5D2D6_GEOSW|nr:MULTISPECIES: hydroxymethylglutaryl-CoA lyase [Bacillaceae]PDM40815.1 hydroxymethylglutaryl-CoA lyase [Parageobacillus yumthangensis]PUF89389.1 hydroxymethylglutaryl-CoA lyase [Geobacillus sp. LYN3]QSB47622.1 hydroxymethylglutaryl-CoA lyase [Parageobacillus toebii]RDV21374.1 hydroxymethylglutaryl-CoA lyase [Parageobacillus toebii]TXK87282.1 hydroxymethylglutaryl-CoA lyase [Geobacillus sp. AYS3]